ncbi:VOC family protein [Mumia sp. DW29H23]|uniref:VOC family protein n=1 Tax=Mumia sp. DW29H23 TaxID=3421241 RepID=UPI003D69992C
MDDDHSTQVTVRYLVDDVQAATEFYSNHLGFSVGFARPPAFTEVLRGSLRLLLSGPTSSGARATPAELNVPGRNRLLLVLDDLDVEIARLEAAGLAFLGDVVEGPGGRQRLLTDPAGNLVELFEAAKEGSA